MDLFQAYASKRGEYSSNGISTDSLGTLLRSKYAVDAPELSPEQSTTLDKQTGKGLGELTKLLFKNVAKRTAKATIPKPFRLDFDPTAQHSTGLEIVDGVGAADKKPMEFSGAIDSVGQPNTTNNSAAAADVAPLDLRYSAVSA